jgi:hypothetical protein
MRVLLTFTGFHDPYTKGLVGQEEQPGPILSLVSVRAFEQVILFSTPSTAEHTQATKDALDTLHPYLRVEIRDVPLHDPTDCNAILRGVRTHLREICVRSQARSFVLRWHQARRRCTPAGFSWQRAVKSRRTFSTSVRPALSAKTAL